MLWPGLVQLQGREIEILQASGVTQFPEQNCRTVEISQSMGWCKPMNRVSSAIIPRSRIYITSRCRLLHGIEALRLQSLHFPTEKLELFREGFIMDLAGNAFEGSCCLAAIVSTCAALAQIYCLHIASVAADTACSKASAATVAMNADDADAESQPSDDSAASLFHVPQFPTI